jgi:hypothetical protein
LRFILLDFARKKNRDSGIALEIVGVEGEHMVDSVSVHGRNESRLVRSFPRR